MPDDNTRHLPILDDIIKPGKSEKAASPSSGRFNKAADSDEQAVKPAAAGHAKPGGLRTPADGERSIVEPVLEDVIATYRPNIDSLTEEVLASVMTELEPLLREKIRQCLKQHFPDTEEPR